jgi:very-short-patch-repair endonuclease
MDDIDVMVRPDGIRVVTPARLAFDLAAVLRPLDLESVIEELVNERHCTIEDLLLMDARLHHPARPGSHEFRAVIGSRPDGGAADSHLEVSLHADLRRRGVSGLVRQYRVELPTGWSIHADLAVPHLRWLIQIDHVAWHGGRIASERDKQNDRLLQQLDYTVSRVSDHDLARRRVSTLDELVAIHQRLRRRVA